MFQLIEGNDFCLFQFISKNSNTQAAQSLWTTKLLTEEKSTYSWEVRINLSLGIDIGKYGPQRLDGFIRAQTVRYLARARLDYWEGLLTD